MAETIYWYEYWSNKKDKKWFWKYIVKLIINTAFGKTMENARKRGGIKLVRTERRRNYLVSEPNYHTTKFFYRKVISSRNEKSRGTYE